LQRQALLQQRTALDKETLTRWGIAIDAHLARGFPGLFRIAGREGPVPVVAIYWPHRNEYDPRDLAAKLRASGSVIALPVAAAPRSPLLFREWHPGAALAPGPGGIPHPAEGTAVVPTTLLLPMVGFDPQGFRLGYGGGYFDRTLAVLHPRPHVIGIAYEISSMASIHPETHDVPMDYIVTEAGIYRREPAENKVVFLGAPPGGELSALSSPVCYAGELGRNLGKPGDA